MPEEDLELERAVHDPRYRRRIIERLKREKSEAADPEHDPAPADRQSTARKPPPGENA